MASQQHDPAPPQDDRPGSGTVDVAHLSPHLAIVTLQGEHDISTGEALEQALRHAAAHSDVLVDLSLCGFVDSTVITILIRAAQTVRAGGERLVLVIPPGQRAVARVAQMTGLGQLVALYDSRDAALAALARRA
jgi:anti-anti-sigma factor